MTETDGLILTSCMCVCTCVYIYISIYVTYRSPCVYICMCVCVCIYICTYLSIPKTGVDAFSLANFPLTDNGEMETFDFVDTSAQAKNFC